MHRVASVAALFRRCFRALVAPRSGAPFQINVTATSKICQDRFNCTTGEGNVFGAQACGT